MPYRYTLYFWWHIHVLCRLHKQLSKQAAFQTYSAGQNISCECVAVRVWNVVERSSTRCCVQDLLTALHVHLMDETNSHAEISDCTNVCYTYHTQHQVSTPVIHARSYGAFCCKPRMTSGSYLRDMWEDPCRSTCYSCTMQVQVSTRNSSDSKSSMRIGCSFVCASSWTVGPGRAHFAANTTTQSTSPDMTWQQVFE